MGEEKSDCQVSEECNRLSVKSPAFPRLEKPGRDSGGRVGKKKSRFDFYPQ